MSPSGGASAGGVVVAHRGLDVSVGLDRHEHPHATGVLHRVGRDLRHEQLGPGRDVRFDARAHQAVPDPPADCGDGHDLVAKTR
jgi:hypothetical protein